MKIKEIFSEAGSLSDYFGYIILLFGWYLLDNVYSTIQPELSGETIELVLTWGLRLLVSPIVFAAVLGGIDERQKIQAAPDRDGLFSHVKSHLWRFIVANLLSIIFYLIVTIIIVLLAGYELQDLYDDKFLIGILSVSFSMINLLWFSAIVVERKIFRGLIRAIKTLLFNPIALGIGILWGVIVFTDTLAFNFEGAPIPLGINIARSGVFAVVRVLAAMSTLALYKNVWVSLSNETEGEETLGGSSTTSSGEKLIKASFGFTFVSFLPLFNLVALILGTIALKRNKRFVLRAAIACCMGGFFTIVYALLIAGYFVSQPSHLQMPGYAFLADGNAELETYVELLNQGAVQEVQAQLGNIASEDPDRQWAFDTALALSKYDDLDLDGALHDFYTALQKNPERSEFYFYYGIALLENEKADMALEQFRLALEHDPELEIAERYITLIQTAYQPSMITSALLLIIVLLMLFTLHEYGHAFAAWKLGDDTAKNQGRLTLNPIPHLDIFGSLLLPAVLLLQQSGAVFGWAKPVPVNPGNFKNPDRDHMLVSFAGPAVNLLVSMVSMVILGLIVLFIRVFWPETLSLNLVAPFSEVSIVGPPLAQWIILLIVFLKQLFYTSLVLGFFNLIPVPPLDGSWILAGFLPQGLRSLFDKARQFSFVIFLLLVMTPIVDYFLSIPIGIAWVGLDVLVSVMGFA